MSGYSKTNDVLGSVNRGDPCESGLCTLCRADCRGSCETWLSSMKGRKMLYPRDFGRGHGGFVQHQPCGCVLQQPAHPGLQLRRVRPSRRVDKLRRRLHLPKCQPRNHVRQSRKDQVTRTADDGGARLYLYCRQILGILCRRRVAGRLSHRHRRKCRRCGQAVRAQGRQYHQRTRAGAAGSTFT